MRIFFICACIEHGKDGVGDYTRSLAKELFRTDNEVEVVAVNDNFVAEIVSEKSVEEHKSFLITRIPSNLKWDEKVKVTRERIKSFNPDLISFQIVPFSYNPYGILKGVIKHFKNIGNGFPVHIMFHELWIGENEDASLKERLLGFIEKKYILKLIKKIRPKVVHVTCQLFVFLLEKNKVESKKLPVFSNIPKVKEIEDLSFKNEKLEGVSIDLNQRNNYWMFIFFGSIHPEWQPKGKLDELKRVSKDKNKNVLIVSVGKTSNVAWHSLVNLYKDSFSFIKVGIKDKEEISSIFYMADFALTTYPGMVIEKSGSIAAFRQHKLPVISLREEIKIKGFNEVMVENPMVIKIEDFEEAFERIDQVKSQDVSMFDISSVASKLLGDLK